jgi:hypothetical protein
MMDAFEVLRQRALERMEGHPAEDFLVRGIWRVELAFRPNPAERTFKYTFWLAMTRGQGCCYCTGDDQRGRELVGHDVRELVREKTCISIAALDSLYASLERRPSASYQLVGNAIQKTDARTEIILHEAERLVSSICGRKPRVVNVGLVGNIVRDLVARGYDVRASDMERDTVGTQVHGVLVEDGTRTYDLVRESDLAIVTGMTIATDSLELILEEARKSGTKVLVFAETGANFGEEYCRSMGVDAAVSELFPFYIFQGVSTIEVYRK